METLGRFRECGGSITAVSGEFTIHKSPPMAGLFGTKEGNSPNFALHGWRRSVA
jgi:hypothetical protein